MMLKIQLRITNKLHFTIYSHRKYLFQIVKIFHNFTVFIYIFDQINAALVIRRIFFQKHKKTHLLTFMSFQTKTFFILWKIKDDVLKNVCVFFISTMKVNGVQCCLDLNNLKNTLFCVLKLHEGK